LPLFTGSPIQVSCLPQLTAHRGRLLSQLPHAGTAVHAGSFIRQRRIVLESELLNHPGRLRFVLLHELFHFAWLRLGNPTRSAFCALLLRESEAGARGELGESAEAAKLRLRPEDAEMRSVRWRQYVCESFCDSAAWVYAKRVGEPERMLAKPWSERRRHCIHRLGGINWRL
jgi:hypothetical protein